jgi:SAM-dependent methyltransferase
MTHTGHCYDTLARAYAAVNASQPWYRHYERPAMLSMFPPIDGARVLDAACGPGWYSEHLAKSGARVTAFDLNAEFVEMTRARATSATVVQADLASPLDFARDGAFDLVVCALALHYVEDWVPTLREFHRVLAPAGRLVFSTHHPIADTQQFSLPDYFATQVIDDEFKDVGPVRYYRRPLTAMFEALHRAGFAVDGLLEPRPTEGFREVQPEAYERLMREPIFLVIRAGKMGSGP